MEQKKNSKEWAGNQELSAVPLVPLSPVYFALQVSHRLIFGLGQVFAWKPVKMLPTKLILTYAKIREAFKLSEQGTKSDGGGDLGVGIWISVVNAGR